MQPWDREQARFALTVALEAAREAGAILLDHYENLDPAGLGRKSSTRDLVSAADVAAERCITAHLRRYLPEHAIEAEEETRDARDAHRPRWFVDPLDGTVNFVQGLPTFCVSLGLYVQGQPEVAVVHAPRLGETFWAVAGEGGRLEGPRGSRPLAVSDKQALSESVLATGFPYRREYWRPNNLEILSDLFLQVRGLRRMGSAALDLALVAAGRLDGFWELYLSPHDVGAGALLVREAGGRVSDAMGGEDWLRGGSIVAGGAGVHGALLPFMRPPDPRWALEGPG
ncbi:MAG: inositol monophosphatase family protein [Planctomycetota bacterium]